MGEAQNFLLAKVDSLVVRASLIEALLEFFRVQNAVHQKTDVVQESGQISFVGIGKTDLLGHFLRDHGATERMTPEGEGIDHPFAFRDKAIHAESEQHGTDAVGSK